MEKNSWIHAGLYCPILVHGLDLGIGLGQGEGSRFQGELGSIVGEVSFAPPGSYSMLMVLGWK